MSEKKPPTDKQKLWLKCYLDESNPKTFLNKRASANAAGYSESPNSGQQVWRYWKKKLDKWMDEEGFTEFKLKMKVLELMEAKETKFFQKDGEIITEREVDALGIQTKATEMAIKIKGLFAPEKRELTGAEGKPLFEMDQKALKDAINSAD